MCVSFSVCKVHYKCVLWKGACRLCWHLNFLSLFPVIKQRPSNTFVHFAGMNEQKKMRETPAETHEVCGHEWRFFLYSFGVSRVRFLSFSLLLSLLFCPVRCSDPFFSPFHFIFLLNDLLLLVQQWLVTYPRREESERFSGV